MTEPVTAGASAVAPRRRRRWPWVVAVIVIIVALLYAAVIWYASSLLGSALALTRSAPDYNLTVTGATRTDITYDETDSANAWADQGLMAVESEQGGWTETGNPTGSDPASRPVAKRVATPRPAAGQKARLEGNYFYRDPLAGLGMPYEQVDITTDGQPSPAWFVPADKNPSTWVIFTHGRGATRAEGLRALSTAGRMGYPTLLISYLGDEGAPQGNGYGQIGAAEWPYLQSAAQYAVDQGAQRLILVGNSMGGATTLAFMKNSPLADQVSALFLDSPVASFGQAVDINAANMGIPGVVIGPAKLVAQMRFGSNFADTDYTASADVIDVPTVVAFGSQDDLVPPQVGQDFVAAVNAAHPGTATYELFPGAEHTGLWNVDRPRYDRLLAALLDAGTRP